MRFICLHHFGFEKLPVLSLFWLGLLTHVKLLPAQHFGGGVVFGARCSSGLLWLQVDLVHYGPRYAEMAAELLEEKLSL